MTEHFNSPEIDSDVNLRDSQANTYDFPTGDTTGTEPSSDRQNKQLIELSALSPEETAESVEPFQSSRTQQVASRLKARATTFAIALSMIPALIIGTTAYYVGNQVLTEQATQARREGRAGLVEAELAQERQLNLLIGLLAGTGATALLAGVIAAIWVHRSVHSAVEAGAVETVRSAVENRDRRTQLFTDAVYEIRASLSQSSILRAAVEETRRVIACDRVLVYSLDEKLEGLIIAESVRPNWPKALRATIKDPCFGARYIEKYQNGRVHAIDDIYQANLTPCYLDQLKAFSVRANLVAPLLNEGKLIGLLIAHQCSGPRVWQQHEIDLFTQLATQVGFALDNATLLAERTRLEQQVEAEAEWKESLIDSTRRIHEWLSEEDVLRASVQEARRVLGCDRVVVYGTNRQSRGVVIAESVAPGWPKALGRIIDDPCFEARYIEKYENGRVRALNNIYEAGMTACYVEQLEKLAVKANLVAPVLHEGKLLGLLVAHQCSGPRVWKTTEIRWFTQIAVQVGFALDNAKLVQQVERMTQDAQVIAFERDRERAQLGQKIAELLKESNLAFADFSTKAVHQAEAVTAAVAQIQSVADSARNMAAGAQKAEVQLQQVSQSIQSGHETINKTVDNIVDLQEAFVDTAARVEHLSQASQKIVQFIDFTKDLVSKMNHQALNATIGAGRSGEASQEAVVFMAETMRALTQQLTRAATEIEPVVVELQSEMNSVATAIEARIQEVDAELGWTQETRQTLNQLATLGDRISSLVSQINNGATEQAQSSTLVSQTILEVANLAHRTSQQSEAVAESFTKLSTVVQELESGLSQSLGS